MFSAQRSATDIGELDRIRHHYSERKNDVTRGRYSVQRSDVFLGMQHVDEVTMDMLKSLGIDDFAGVRLLEVGCGSGGNLLRFLRWGFAPENLVGNELLEERAAQARDVLPAKTAIIVGDARNLGTDRFDIVYQSTMLSSILDDDFQTELARKMWRLTQPGGVVLSYDFVFNNRFNQDVRKVTVDRLRELFPSGELTARRVTLAPPIARRVSRVRLVYAALNTLPALRTHSVCAIRKPK